MKSRIYLLAVLSLAMATFLLVHFSMIWVYGSFYIYESNKFVLLLETTLIIAILSISSFCILEQVVNRRAIAKQHDVYVTGSTKQA